MELRQLRYFLTVAEEQHFTRAAEKLYVSQPALSQQIRQLEQELGVTLLDRADRHVHLTGPGEVFARYARRVFQELDDARIALNELAGLQRGSLVVGVVQTVNACVMPQVLAAFMASYPGITMRVEELAANGIEHGVAGGTLQIGVGFIPPANNHIEAEPLFTEELVLVTTRAHPLAGRACVEVRELASVPLILLSQAFCTRRLWDACTQRAGTQSRVLAEMNTIDALLATTSRTHVATILPALALRGAYAQTLVGIRLAHPAPQRTVGFLCRRGGYRCAATQAFTQIFRDIGRRLTADLPLDTSTTDAAGARSGTLRG